jgi:hypothetical protein
MGHVARGQLGPRERAMADAAKPMFKVAQRDGDWFWRVDN